MKIGVIIPDRNDRPEFLQNCLRMMKAQTLQPSFILVVDMPAKSDACDITFRYRTGYQFFDQLNYDVLAFIENDDYYHPTYLETMVREWEKAGKPDLFGTNQTIYYHIWLRKYMTMFHSERSCMMNTLIVPGMKFIWPLDHDPYTDQWIWMENISGIQSKKLFTPEKMISFGIKHGVGKVGGGSHTTDLDRYDNDDPLLIWLKENTDAESYRFYFDYSYLLHLKSLKV
jgi:glycosyltransferase involved in cell wall biosynthesis